MRREWALLRLFDHLLCEDIVELVYGYLDTAALMSLSKVRLSLMILFESVPHAWPHPSYCDEQVSRATRVQAQSHVRVILSGSIVDNLDARRPPTCFGRYGQ
jgi:hypothetical protein